LPFELCFLNCYNGEICHLISETKYVFWTSGIKTVESSNQPSYHILAYYINSSEISGDLLREKSIFSHVKINTLLLLRLEHVLHGSIVTHFVCQKLVWSLKRKHGLKLVHKIPYGRRQTIFSSMKQWPRKKNWKLKTSTVGEDFFQPRQQQIRKIIVDQVCECDLSLNREYY